jgi:hypothetical protein
LKVEFPAPKVIPRIKRAGEVLKGASRLRANSPQEIPHMFALVLDAVDICTIAHADLVLAKNLHHETTVGLVCCCEGEEELGSWPAEVASTWGAVSFVSARSDEEFVIAFGAGVGVVNDYQRSRDFEKGFVDH